MYMQNLHMTLKQDVSHISSGSTGDTEKTWATFSLVCSIDYFGFKVYLFHLHVYMLNSADWCVTHTGTIHWKVVNVTSNDPGSSCVGFIDFVYCVPKNNSICVVLSEEQISKEWLCSVLDGPSTISNWSCVTGTCPLTYCRQGVIKSMTGWWFEICLFSSLFRERTLFD